MAHDLHTTVSGAANGVSHRASFDRWLRYPAGLSPAALDASFALLAGGFDDSDVVVDPFCGVGTVGTHARTRSLGFVGIEAHPWIASAAALKFACPGPTDGLRGHAQDITADLEPAPIGDEHELIRRSFAPEVLGLLVALRTRIRKLGGPWHRHLELALMSNLRSHACVKVGWPYQLPGQRREARSTDPARFLVRRISMMADDLDGIEQDAPAATIICGDSRQPNTWSTIDLNSASGAISSPPYLNNFDYADATRLEMYFAGTVSSWKELCTEVRTGMVVATTQQTSVSRAQEAFEGLTRWPGIQAHVRRIAADLERERVRRDRGKEYSRVVAPYFNDVGRVLENLAAALPSGAPVVLVVGDSAPYGVYIDTPAILLALGTEIGLDPIGTRLLRSRGKKWRTNGTRHQVPLSERLVEFRVAS